MTPATNDLWRNSMTEHYGGTYDGPLWRNIMTELMTEHYDGPLWRNIMMDIRFEIRQTTQLWRTIIGGTL